MTWALVAVIVLTLGAIGYFVHVGRVFREKEYLQENEQGRKDQERLNARSKAAQEKREIRHEERLREIDGARRDPAEYEQLLNTWPDDAEDPPPVSTGNGAGGGAGGNLH